MSSEGRTIENTLLKERRKLINTGMEHKFIKIRGNSLYVKNKLHGSVTDTHFHLATNFTDTTHMATQNQQSPMDSNTNESNSSHTQNNENYDTSSMDTSKTTGNDSSWLSVLYINPRSIVNKLKQFQSLVYSKSLDLIGLTETWLNEYIFDNEILPSNYTLFRKDHPSHGGGVLIAVSD